MHSKGVGGLAEIPTMLIIYLGAWLVITAVLSRILGESNSISITPLSVMVRTPIVFKLFDKLRGRRIVALLLDSAILAATLSMAIYYYGMIKSLLSIITGGETTAAIVPLLPGITIEIKTFLYLLPGLSLAIIFHEAFHALASRYEGVRIKSSGFLVILGLLPAAFVEPDEQELKSTRVRAKLRIYAAGVLANLMLFLLFQATMFAATAPGVYTYIVDVAPDSFAYEAGLKPGTIVEYFIVNGTELRGVPELTRYLLEVKREHNNSLAHVTLIVRIVLLEGEEITIVKKSAPTNISDMEKYERIGIYMFDLPAGFVELLPPNVALHLSIIIMYAVIINFSLAIINAAPLFITDGAQIVNSIAEYYTRDERKAKIITATVSTLSLLLLVPNIVI